MSNSKSYYFILGSESFLLKEEPLEEMLRERAQNYIKNKKELDFWILTNPKFLSSQKFDKTIKKEEKNIVAIVSNNKSFITWLKLRLNNVLKGRIDICDKSTKKHSLLDYESLCN